MNENIDGMLARLGFGGPEIKKEENHLENILKILNIHNFDEEIIRLLNIYIATRGLQENYYSSLSENELLKCKEEIDKILKDD